MSATQYIGTTDFTAQPVSGSFIQGQGWNKTIPYRGSKLQLNAFLAQVFILAQAFGGVNGIRWTEDGPYALVEVTYAISPFDPQVQDPISVTWTLVPNMIEISIWNHPKIQNGYTDAQGAHHIGLSSYDLPALAALRDQINRIMQGDTGITYDPGSVGDVLSRLIARGDESLVVPQYVLKKTQTVFSQTQLVASHKNVGAIHDFIALMASEPTLPSAILIDPLTLAKQQIGQSALFWLKMAPEVDQVAGGKYQIIQEWWGTASFDSFIYDVVT